MEQKIANDRFLALSRICLNNWHYITKRTLSFNDEINFFTGHSGSGKSTVIDVNNAIRPGLGGSILDIDTGEMDMLMRAGRPCTHCHPLYF